MSDNVATLKRASIEAGAIVTLKTGGPQMVVMERLADKAHCAWHKEDGDLLRDWVPTVCLKVKE